MPRPAREGNRTSKAPSSTAEVPGLLAVDHQGQLQAGREVERGPAHEATAATSAPSWSRVRSSAFPPQPSGHRPSGAWSWRAGPSMGSRAPVKTSGCPPPVGQAARATQSPSSGGRRQWAGLQWADEACLHGTGAERADQMARSLDQTEVDGEIVELRDPVDGLAVIWRVGVEVVPEATVDEDVDDVREREE